MSLIDDWRKMVLLKEGKYSAQKEGEICSDSSVTESSSHESSCISFVFKISISFFENDLLPESVRILTRPSKINKISKALCW